MKSFWDKVSKTETCWVWTGYKIYSGYGHFRFRGGARRAHRVSYILTFGEIPHGLCVLHKCDNRGCVNPDHLFLGTQQKNMEDKVHKNRQTMGESAVYSKLSADEVRRIRTMYSETKISQKKLADDFGVTPSSIRDILRRKNWKHI